VNIKNIKIYDIKIKLLGLPLCRNNFITLLEVELLCVFTVKISNEFRKVLLRTHLLRMEWFIPDCVSHYRLLFSIFCTWTLIAFSLREISGLFQNKLRSFHMLQNAKEQQRQRAICNRTVFLLLFSVINNSPEIVIKVLSAPFRAVQLCKLLISVLQVLLRPSRPNISLIIPKWDWKHTAKLSILALHCTILTKVTIMVTLREMW
jgi:hypothetical protein